MLKSNLLIYSIVDLNSIFHFKESLSITGLGLILLAHMENSNSESISTISSVESVSIVINPENITNDELLEEPLEENVEDDDDDEDDCDLGGLCVMLIAVICLFVLLVIFLNQRQKSNLWIPDSNTV